MFSPSHLAICFGVMWTEISGIPKADDSSLPQQPTVLDTPIVKLSVDILQQLNSASKSKGENILFSPTNVFKTFLLAYFASAGNTRAQLARALHIGQLAAEQVAHAHRTATRPHQSGVLETQRLYLDSSVEVRSEFRALLGEDIESVDFATDPPGTVDKVNRWTADVTNHLIPYILGESLPRSTRALLLSAIYFRGRWMTSFNEQSTYEAEFTTASGEKVAVDMMWKRKMLPLSESGVLGSTVLSVPFTDPSCSLVLLLPDSGQSVGHVVDKLSVDTLSGALGTLGEAEVDLHLPKFNISQEVNLMRVMADLGVTDLFGELSDLSNLAEEPLQVDGAVQKVALSVTENGTTAAAVAHIKMGPRTITFGPVTKLLFDQPFIFIIYNSVLQIPLFMGVLNDPRM